MINPNTTQPDQIKPETTVKDRLGALVDAVIDKSKLNRAFLPVIRNLAKNFLEEVSEEDIKNGIKELRDKYIPWILGEMPDDKNPSSQ